jgi:hypothetical protein
VRATVHIRLFHAVRRPVISDGRSMTNVPITDRRRVPNGASSRPDDLPLVRVQGPADLAQAIPYLLGFHPARSLVLVGLAGKRVVVTARADLGDLTDDTLLPRTITAMARGGAGAFVGVVFDDDVPSEPVGGVGGQLPWRELATEVRSCAVDAGAEVDEIVLVSRGRMWSYDCDDSRCCPPSGRVLDGTSPVAAAAAYAGLVALPDRESLAELLRPTFDLRRSGELLGRLQAAEKDAVRALLTGEQSRLDRADVRALFAAARAFDARGADPALTPEQVVRFSVALRRLTVRDSVWLGVDDERIDGRRLWQRLATSVPAPFGAAPLFLFGWATYRAGDGALAGTAAELALDSDPDYSAADLILSALTNAIDPRRLPRLRPRRQRSAKGG